MQNKPIYHKILPRGEFFTYAQRPDLDLVRTHQIHSTAISPYKGSDLSNVESDGVLFKFSTLMTKKVSIAITTADCMPVLFLGEHEGVFLHAGWRGLADGILLNKHIKSIAPHYCMIGPSIRLESFEVQEQFREHFKENEFFHDINGSLHFDLIAKATKDIVLNYPQIQLEVADHCTFIDSKFHSYRRDKTKQRNWNIFTL
ncbi:MAG: polyphenol oxidase family protein [Bacteriovoracaceae bacterium]|nr:polyphenol oxidase family protein [Bacteriovoracaceae bacterium]